MSIQIDSDWKKQAQEEKRKLAEQTAQAKAAQSAPIAPSQAAPATRARQMPAAGFASIVQSMMTQTLYYLGELAEEGDSGAMNLDMAKYHIDTLAVLEAKTKGNLTPQEQSVLDQAMYDLRSRFVGVARQMIM